MLPSVRRAARPARSGWSRGGSLQGALPAPLFEIANLLRMPANLQREVRIFPRQGSLPSLRSDGPTACHVIKTPALLFVRIAGQFDQGPHVRRPARRRIVEIRLRQKTEGNEPARALRREESREAAPRQFLQRIDGDFARAHGIEMDVIDQAHQCRVVLRSPETNRGPTIVPPGFDSTLPADTLRSGQPLVSDT